MSRTGPISLPDSLNRQRILDYLRACYAGDIDRAAAYYDDEIDFIAFAPVDLFPTLGQRIGKSALVDSLRSLNERYAPIQYDVTSIVAEDERVAVTLDLRLFARGGDRVISLQIANFCTLARGRIRTYRQFLDSFDAVQQLLRRDIAAVLRRPDRARR